MVQFRVDRRFSFPLTQDELWDRLTRVDDFPRWWPWLRRIDGDGFVAGGVTRATIVAPVPWTLRLTLRVTELTEARSARVAVSGDLEGTGELTVAAATEGAVARIRWNVSPSSPALRMATRMTYPLVVFGQNWVVNAGLRQFRASAT